MRTREETMGARAVKWREGEREMACRERCVRAGESQPSVVRIRLEGPSPAQMAGMATNGWLESFEQRHHHSHPIVSPVSRMAMARGRERSSVCSSATRSSEVFFWLALGQAVGRGFPPWMALHRLHEAPHVGRNLVR